MAPAPFPDRGARLTFRSRRTACAALLALAACTSSSELTYRPFEDPRLGVAFNAPGGWTEYTDGAGGKPAGFAMFVRDPDRIDDQWTGPALGIHRLSRLRSEFPGSDAQFEQYRAVDLKSPEDIFKQSPPAVSTASVAGAPARFVVTNVSMEAPKSSALPNGGAVRIRIETLVIERPEAFYVLEYRSNWKRFDQASETFEQARRSFRFLQPIR